MNYKTFLDILILANKLNNDDYLSINKINSCENFTFDGSIDKKSIENAIRILRKLNKCDS